MEIITAYKDLLIIATLFVTTAVLIYLFWDKIEFWWLNATYSFPLIGTLSKLKKNHQVKENGVFDSEEQLCNDYIIHYNKFKKDAAAYTKAENYLDLLDEKKRKPMNLLVWALIITLVVIESVGFAYVLSGFITIGGSEDAKQMSALGIGVMVSILLVSLTHHTGHVLYENSVLKKIRFWWRQDQANPNRPQLVKQDGITLETQDDDKGEPLYIRFLSRVSANATVTPSYVMPIVTALLIILVAVGSTYIRGEVLAQEMIAERAATSETVSTTNAWGETPSALQADQSAADSQVEEETREHFQKGAWVAFIVIAIIFVFLQIFGTLLGYTRGFMGEDSLKAYNLIKGFSSRDEFEHYYEEKQNKVTKIAQAKLQELQQEMKELLDSGATENPTKHRPSMTFNQYIIAHKHNRLSRDRASSDIQDQHDQSEEEREIALHEAKMKKMKDRKKRHEEAKAMEEELAALTEIDSGSGDKV